jgi:YVTN family beta-propeller protein
MSKRPAALLIAITILPAAAGVSAAEARRSHPSTLLHAGVAARPERIVNALEQHVGDSGAPRLLGPGVPGGTFTAAPPAQTIGTLPRVLVGNTPQDAVFDPATRTVYVANQNDNTVSVVDSRRCNARDTTGCGQTPPTVVAGNGPFGIGIDTATDTIYVTDSSSNTVSVINAATCNAENTSGCGQTPATLTVGQGPAGIAVDPATDTVYVTNAGPNLDGSGDTVSVIDGATCNATNTSGCGQVPATVTVGHFAFTPALDTANHTLYVTDALDNTVSMIDTTSCHAGATSGCAQTPPTAAVGQFPVPVVVDSKTDTVYVGNNNEPTVSVLDGASCNAADTSGCRPHPITLHVQGGPDGLAINQATETLFAANNGPGNSTARTNSVSVINAATCNAQITSGCDQHAPTMLTGANPGGNTVDEATNTLYVTTFDNTLQVINGATCNQTVITGCGQPTPATLAGNVPVSVAINQATSTAYVGDSAEFDGYPSWTISVLHTKTCNAINRTGCNPSPPTITTQLNPYALAVNQATDTLYATNLEDSNHNPGNTVSVIDGATCNATVTSGCGNTPPTVTVGTAPHGVAVDQATDTIYVANSGEDTLSVINGKTCNATNTAGCGQAPVKVPLANTPLYRSTAVAVNQATDTVYILNQGTPGTVSALNGATCNASVTTGCDKKPPTVTVGNASGPGALEPAGLAVDQTTNTIYVDNTTDDTVSVIDGATCNGTNTSGCHQTPAHVAVGRQAFGYVAVDPATDLVYVTDYLDDAVSIIDGATCNATHTGGCDQTPPTVPAGASPVGLAVDQHNHNLYVADNGNGPVSFFRFQTPGTPTRVRASTYRGQAEVVWQPPADGGLPIIYHLIPTPACPACTGLTTPSTSGAPYTTINGLTPRQSYTFKVQATNAAGPGPTSAPSNAITP